MHKSLNHKRINDSMNFVSGTHKGYATFVSFIGLSTFFYPYCASSSHAILTVEPDLRMKKLSLESRKFS